MKIATKSFRFEDRYGGGTVEKGDRVDDDHPLLREFPGCWRDFGLADELKVRSDCIAEMRERAARPAGRQPVSEAGRAEAREADFWRSTEALLERTRDDQPTAEQRREEDFYNRALQQIEDSDAARLRDERIAIGEAWYGRLEE